ncbi:MAG: D-isomer specific 2-hydroxyacid dehydrogenase family protein [Bacteroidota bacterium]
MAKVLIAEAEDFSLDVVERLKKYASVDMFACKQSELKTLLEQYDIFWFRLGFKIDETVLSNQTRCKIIATPVTGIDHIDEDLCAQLGMKIVCLRGETEFLKEVRATAEHTILLAMMLMRKAKQAAIDAEKGNWRRDLFRGFELYKKKVGIIGYGRLGSIVADYFQALGCEVGYYDIAEKPSTDRIKVYNSLESCIVANDIISIHIPYNSSTHHLFDQQIFQLFDENKWLLNTSRGGVVDEAALLQALSENRIAGAALDVLYGEPDILQHPLIEYTQQKDNLVITPHIGGCTYESFEKTEHFIADKIIGLIAK